VIGEPRWVGVLVQAARCPRAAIAAREDAAERDLRGVDVVRGVGVRGTLQRSVFFYLGGGRIAGNSAA